MLSVVAGVLFTLAPLQQADAAGELQAALQKLTQAESVQFALVSETASSNQEGAGGGGRGGMGGGGPMKASGLWKKGLPMQLTVGDQVAFKQGGKIVHKGSEGQWQVLEMGRGGRGAGGPGGAPGAPGGEGGGAGGGAGGGTGGAAGGVARPPEGAGPGGGPRTLLGLASVEAPADVFSDFGSKVADVKKETKDGALVFSGKLSEKGAESLGGRGPRPGGQRGGQGGGEGGDTPQVETSGTYAITVKDGAVISAVFEVKRAGTMGERTFERTTKRTLTIEKVGDVALEVPAEVLELLK